MSAPKDLDPRVGIWRVEPLPSFSCLRGNHVEDCTKEIWVL